MSPQSEEISQSSQPSDADLRTLVNDAVFYLLASHESKHAILRQNIIKHCFPNYGRAFKAVISEAKVVLKEKFGMELIELNTKSKYILVNSHNLSKMTVCLPWKDHEEKSQYILLMLALSHIFMSSGVVEEDLMWKFLNKLQIRTENRKDPFFGEVRKLMTSNFVSQLYLEYRRLPDQDPPVHEFRWGPRAEQEVSHLQVLKFVTDIHKMKNVEEWTMQYKDMLTKETKKLSGEQAIDADDS